MALIRKIYGEVERLSRDTETVVVEDVVANVRQLIQEQTEPRSTGPVLMRSDLISVTGQFRQSFTFIPSVPAQNVSVEKVDLLSFVSRRSSQCRQENRISTSRGYGNLQKELSAFCGSGSIAWRDVNALFVGDFASWLDRRDYKASTKSYYLGMLRTILFQARDEGYCDASSDWFRSIKIESVPKPNVQAGKKIDMEVVRKIAALDLSGREELQMIRDMFMFAFLCRGMELVDIAHLTKDNLHEGILTYNKRLSGKEISVTLDTEALNILQRYESTGRYLFPLLTTGRSTLFTSRRNIVVMRIKEIGNMVGFPGLTFKCNIDAWKTFITTIHISEQLHYSPSGT